MSTREIADQLAKSKYPLIRKLAEMFISKEVSEDTVVEIEFQKVKCTATIRNLFKTIWDGIENGFDDYAAQLYDKAFESLIQTLSLNKTMSTGT